MGLVYKQNYVMGVYNVASPMFISGGEYYVIITL